MRRPRLLSRRGVQASQAAAFLAAPGVQSTGSVVAAQGLVALRRVGSSRTRDRTRVSCAGRWICYHGTSREALYLFYVCCFFFFLAVLLQVWSLGQKHHVEVWKTCTFSGPPPQISTTKRHLRFGGRRVCNSRGRADPPPRGTALDSHPHQVTLRSLPTLPPPSPLSVIQPALATPAPSKHLLKALPTLSLLPDEDVHTPLQMHKLRLSRGRTVSMGPGLTKPT